MIWKNNLLNINGVIKMEYIFETQNTCAKKIKFNLNGNIVTDVEFLEGGCPRKSSSNTKTCW